MKNIFIEGAIPPEKIAHSIQNHQSKIGIGAHNLFLGQVRADEVDGKQVAAIEYTAQVEMANQLCHDIRESAYEQYPLTCMHIYHSLGQVATGELCFFVFVSSAHRPAVFESLPVIVDRIKAELPIFGKEVFADETHQWKVNR